MDTFLQLLSSGLALGAVYALVALGFVVIYRSSQIFNFAQGEFLTIGALLMVSLSSAGLPWGFALAGATALTGLLGALVERLALRPLIGRPVFVPIILTIFLGLMLRVGAILVWGPEPRGMPTPWESTASFALGEARVLYSAAGAVVASALALGAFFALIRGTRLGVAMRAAASDQEVALALGVPVGKIFSLTWFIAGALAALGGVSLAMFPRSADVNLGFVALRAFPAVIVGGLDAPGGTVVAAFALGALEVLAQGYLNPRLGAFGENFHSAFPYLVMIAVLIVRPYGLAGTKDVERV